MNRGRTYDALSQRRLPPALRLYVLAPATVAAVVLAGLTLTLPPGPLCDEGMVLFLEGGCDWGASNEFFFAKLGALAAANFAFVVAWRRRVSARSPFVPHFLLLVSLAIVYRSGGRCDTYYSHPNGSFGQMALEIAAFCFAGLWLLPWTRGRSWRAPAAVLAGWNAAHVGLFYAALEVTPHWTWLHTALVGTALVAAGGLAEGVRRLLRRAPRPGAAPA